MADVPASFESWWQYTFIANTLGLPTRHSPLMDELWRRHQAHLSEYVALENAVLEILHEEGIEL